MACGLDTFSFSRVGHGVDGIKVHLNYYSSIAVFQPTSARLSSARERLSSAASFSASAEAPLVEVQTISALVNTHTVPSHRGILHPLNVHHTSFGYYPASFALVNENGNVPKRRIIESHLWTTKVLFLGNINSQVYHPSNVIFVNPGIFFQHERF
jgi:hypothetical protein